MSSALSLKSGNAPRNAGVQAREIFRAVDGDSGLVLPVPTPRVSDQFVDRGGRCAVPHFVEPAQWRAPAFCFVDGSRLSRRAAVCGAWAVGKDRVGRHTHEGT